MRVDTSSQKETHCSEHERRRKNPAGGEATGTAPPSLDASGADTLPELVKTHHPDRTGDGDNPEMAQINEAYALVMHYCRSYKISFAADKVHEQPDDWWAQQFGDML